ncbi:hypothetical protein A2Z00_01445 [Candidatus Gottesmanbacteria bacterium RBG_13_45_10]|uniref:Uncharacterized protein n=1 Tax=Candidatus Gottesmanbacteria bacterium RBG_13_45_10 TaxID=1798370 RepID=A0A1F5ZHH4_9BACT|nr:MAG: hypothetical protein A2Z00_01445 [Candidatus Gottesmanbacteria bacterium RBG_13_45_10]
MFYSAQKDITRHFPNGWYILRGFSISSLFYFEVINIFVLIGKKIPLPLSLGGLYKFLISYMSDFGFLALLLSSIWLLSNIVATGLVTFFEERKKEWRKRATVVLINTLASIPLSFLAFVLFIGVYFSVSILLLALQPLLFHAISF